jgi:deoxyribodipyrimidine photo-lyase
MSPLTRHFSTMVWLHHMPPQGGEAAALARLKYYLWDSDLIFEYFNIRNGMLGGDYSTKLAPWLAAGNISPRTIYHEVCGAQGGCLWSHVARHCRRRLVSP